MKTIFISILYIFLSIPLIGQVFLEEDFANGIPEDWTSEDLSGIGFNGLFALIHLLMEH